MPLASGRSKPVRTVLPTARCSGLVWPPTGTRPCRLGPAWLARPTSTNFHAVDDRPPRPAGTGARFSAQEIATTLTGAPLPTRAAPQRAAGGFCLSFCLIHSRPGPFTDVHPDRVCAVRGRWRTSVNAGQHCWKACWGQPLASSNLASSALLTRQYAGWAMHAARPGKLRSLIHSLILFTYHHKTVKSGFCHPEAISGASPARSRPAPPVPAAAGRGRACRRSAGRGPPAPPGRRRGRW